MAARRPSARARTTSAYFERTRFPLRRRRRLLPPSLPRFLRSLCPCRRQRRARSLNPMRSVSLPLICPLPWRRCRWRWRRAPPPLCLPARHGRGRPLLPLPQTDRVATRSVGRSASRAVRRFIGSATETAASSSGVGVASRCALCPSCCCRCHRRRRRRCRRSCCCCSCGRKGLIFAGCRDGACRFHERRTLPNQGRIKKVWRGEGSSESHLLTVGLRLPW